MIYCPLHLSSTYAGLNKVNSHTQPQTSTKNNAGYMYILNTQCYANTNNLKKTNTTQLVYIRTDQNIKIIITVVSEMGLNCLFYLFWLDCILVSKGTWKWELLVCMCQPGFKLAADNRCNNGVKR